MQSSRLSAGTIVVKQKNPCYDGAYILIEGDRQ